MPTRYGNKYLKTKQILNSLDITEYLALDAGQKDILMLIVSAGEVDFDPDTPVWNVLHGLFPDESVTWTTLMENVKQEYGGIF